MAVTGSAEPLPLLFQYSYEYEADQAKTFHRGGPGSCAFRSPRPGRDEVDGAYKGVSETVPPGGGGALVAAAPLHTLSRAFVLSPPTFWWGKAQHDHKPKSRSRAFP